ncbi:redox-sensing transcriptional repressor Rex [Rhodococcus sp. SRB_17]|uniref:redox-sensing transcriptional repressor Rex n=1 Tax=Rhodococcus sp. OK302 TaxID=1882769 RepID=UPI000B940374|nr:redox-sensing transcriptional repressor Rex [Rhodococcus sp. OK302]NMM83932.1 redox-sensing transcriptional repressor Rex [Rhodococcus sp. SRB_17]OYD68750.1 redox-sensing transcriptional repressor [Rhodococcus sp. OK302]
MSVGRGANDVTEPHQTHEPLAQRVTGAAGTSVTTAGAASADSAATTQDRVIPQATVTRLAAYLRVLGVMSDRGTSIVSSEELAQASGVGSAKLRKDLSFLGPNGVRGVGYDVTKLRIRIERALGLDRGHKVVLVGVGNLGKALVGYGGFSRRGFEMVGLFDSDSGRVGTQVGELTVRDTTELESACRELKATIGVISTPDEAAQDVCDQFVQAGLRCIMSFSPIALDVPDHVELRRVDLAVEMQVLSFNSARNADQASNGPRVRVAHAASASSIPSTSSPAPVGAGSTRNGSVIAP